MADEFNNQTQNNDEQVQNAVNAALDQQKKQKKKKKLIILGVIVAVIVVIAVAAGSGSSDKETTNPVETIAGSGETAADSGETAEAEETTEATSEKVEPGNSITIGNKLTISYTECNTNFTDYNQFCAPADGKKYVSATFKMDNISDSDYSVGDIKCFADGVECSSAYVGQDEIETLSYSTISAGRSISGTVFFSVPENAEEIELEFDASFWSNNKRIIFTVK